MYEINSKENVLEAIFICQLHDIKGKQIVQCYPRIDENSIITHQSFDLIVELIIPIDQLCNRVICLEFKEDYFIIGIPVLARNKQAYFRTIFKYGVMMLVRKDEYMKNRQMYIEIVRKITYFFVCLEDEKHIIYKLNRSSVKQLLQNIFNGFNIKKQAYLEYQCQHYTFISARIPQKRESIVIKPYQVPITNLSMAQIQSLQFDQIKQLMKLIHKGEECIKKIAQTMGKDISSVIEQIKIGIEYGTIFLVDIFSMQNVYVLTQKIHQFASDSNKLFKLRQILLGKDSKLCTIDELCQLYLKFNRKFTVEKIFNINPVLFEKASILKFVRYGLIKGIIKRSYELIYSGKPTSYKKYFNKDRYNQYFKNIKEFNENDNTNTIELKVIKLNQEFNAYVKNNYTLDEVCLNLCIDRPTLLQILKQQGIQTILS